MAIHARALDVDDADALIAIDRAYAEANGLEPVATVASIRFFCRSGHAFSAVDGDGVLRGFVLAHAVFDGERPTVRTARLASVPAGDGAVLRALLRGLTKSAYDAGVYDLLVDVPGADLASAAALQLESFVPRNVVVYGRTLGSRGARERDDASQPDPGRERHDG